jgi:hypothetical protein
MEHTPLQFSGVSLGMSVVLVLIGSSIGPAISAVYLQTYQEIAKGLSNGSGGSFPSPLSYNLIFLSHIDFGYIYWICNLFKKNDNVDDTITNNNEEIRIQKQAKKGRCRERSKREKLGPVRTLETENYLHAR